ncbi:hypothetical protein GQ53DRAFT_755621 [Thozetella sp. PMI_491]|nr:hypothetical protein GQ53DRAFT_755621 [Thozetella sp. PMI_491]
MKESVGEVSSWGTIQDIWEKYANSIDTDAAKKSWMELARFMVTAIAHKARGISGMVEGIVEIVDKLNLNVDAPGEEGEGSPK